MGKRKTSEPSAIQKALADIEQHKERRKKLPKPEDLKILCAQMRDTIGKAKTAMEKLEERKAAARPLRTRSGLRRGANQKGAGAYTDGHVVNKGMDDVGETFDSDEQEFLKKEIRAEISQVKDLKYHQLRYLIKYEFLNDLNKIKAGKLKSDFHNQFHDSSVPKDDLRSEIRTSLFTNEQRDYINGFLQGIFEANKKDAKGNLRHKEMEYVSIVMLYETIIRIVKLVHEFKSFKETIAFMKKKSRESMGISDDEDD